MDLLCWVAVETLKPHGKSIWAEGILKQPRSIHVLLVPKTRWFLLNHPLIYLFTSNKEFMKVNYLECSTCCLFPIPYLFFLDPVAVSIFNGTCILHFTELKRNLSKAGAFIKWTSILEAKITVRERMQMGQGSTAKWKTGICLWATCSAVRKTGI